MTSKFFIQFLETNHFPTSLPRSNTSEYTFSFINHMEKIGKHAIVSCHPSNPLIPGKEMATVEILDAGGACVFRKFLIPNTCYSILFQFQRHFHVLQVSVRPITDTFNRDTMHTGITHSTLMHADIKDTAIKDTAIKDTAIKDTAIEDTALMQTELMQMNANIESSRLAVLKSTFEKEFSIMESIIASHFPTPESRQRHTHTLYASVEEGIQMAKQKFHEMLARIRARQRVLLRNALNNVKQLMKESPPKDATPIRLLRWSKSHLQVVFDDIDTCHKMIDTEGLLQSVRMPPLLNMESKASMKELLTKLIPLLLIEIQHRGLDRVEGMDILVKERKKLNKEIHEKVTSTMPNLVMKLEALN